MTQARSLAGAALAALLLAAFAPAAHAGVFSVTPVRIYMALRDRAVAITLTNEGDTEVALQADINAWTQGADGSDEMALTEDLILAPPIIKLAPKARQVVRLALLRAPDPSRQLTYRMTVREVPEAVATPAGMEIPIAVALSMPVFVTPPTAARLVTCEAARDAKGAAQAVCRNAGNAYAQVREATLRRGDTVLATFAGGEYILPGVRKPISLASAAPVAPGAASLAVAFDDGKTQVFDVTLP